MLCYYVTHYCGLQDFSCCGGDDCDGNEAMMAMAVVVVVVITALSPQTMH